MIAVALYIASLRRKVTPIQQFHHALALTTMKVRNDWDAIARQA